MEHSKRTRLRARLNDPAEVQKALRAFFKFKTFVKAPISDQQIGPVQQGYEYIRTIEAANLGINSMRQALQALEIAQPQDEGQKLGQDGLKPKARLALMIYLDLLRECQITNHPTSANDLYSCVSTLCSCGTPGKALEMLTTDVLEATSLLPSLKAIEVSADDNRSPNVALSERKSSWTRLLQGFAELKDARQLTQAWETAVKQGVDMSDSPKCMSIMCSFYAQQDMLDDAKEWYNRLGVKKWWYSKLRHPASGFLECYESLIWACIRGNDETWGKQLVADIFEVDPEKPFLDLVLVWALASGKGVEEVERMIKLMQQSSGYSADIDTINALISLALWRKDAYTAERVSHMAEKKRIELNSQTFVLQMDYRLVIGDIDGALGAYGRMQRETMTEEGQGIATVNRLVRAMCESRRHDFESIMDVAADMTDQNMRFEAKTVSTLAVLHLSRAEVEDAEDLLNTYSYSCTLAERQEILEAVLDLCTKSSTQSELVWTIYEMLKKAFDDMNRDQRKRLMVEFFMRSRGDLAVQVFEDMRLHTREDTLPTIDTYVSCLIGIEVLEEQESFSKLYNMLKLDTSIEPDTKLHNALMSTCISCGMMQKALSFWDAVTTSDEGPDLRSVRLAFKACENAPGGDVKALNIHLRLEQSGFEVQPAYLAWLLGALGGNGKISEALELITRFDKDRGIAPTVIMIGSLVNASKDLDEQNRILSWAEAKYPVIASQLKQREAGADGWGRRQFNISEGGR